jgi:hypothetical protein
VMKYEKKEETEEKHETFKMPPPHRECLHDNCPSCGGTGVKKNGLGSCIHMISCPCPKCSPFSMR